MGGDKGKGVKRPRDDEEEAKAKPKKMTPEELRAAEEAIFADESDDGDFDEDGEEDEDEDEIASDDTDATDGDEEDEDGGEEEDPNGQDGEDDLDEDEDEDGGNEDGDDGGAGPEDEDDDDEDDEGVSGSEEEDDDEDDEDDDEEDDESEHDEEVNVDFEFFDPKPDDFHGIKQLMQNYLDGKVYNSSELCDILIAQTSVGTIIRTSEDEAAVGLVSCLNLQKHKGSECMKEVLAYMQSKCSNKETKAQLLQAIQAPGTGFMVSERLINCPPQLAAPLTSAIFDEIEWATEDEETEEARKEFKFKQYLTFTRVYRDSSSGAEPGSSKSAKKGNQPDEVLVYVRPEDEFIHKLSTWSYTFEVEQPQRDDDDLKMVRMVMLLDASKVKQVRNELQAVTDAAAAP
mmetsp:Transcript_15350/g.18500  ORF Transcript_15350/g.18500 Transcript_15350/m.18500 type:complete len:402 (+) Transcript_15350:127-1332(+)|eukprot:CAMPEP_0197844188 /NCGR_PEP_ID=MMETSP1438-20131217/1172_1 /TAXON_ID=1461541 /ORGANISM="Pterosperma sp., Strain CCMP1384" /LENGTH=401 /DNA_ID=CAMNT_0043454837 /DNA_START=126 /DNA_END=1331 /DNA_ORIENTATION=-